MVERPVRIIYTDLDGTMLGSGGSLFRTATGRFTQAGAAALELCRSRSADVTIVSGRSVALLHEDARLLGVKNYICESGCVVVREGGRVTRVNCGPFGAGGKRVFDEIAATGAPRLLLERFAGRLAYNDPWFTAHDYSHLMRGYIDVAEADALLAGGGLDELRVVDNGIIEDRGYGMGVAELHAYHLIPRRAGKGAAIRIDLEMAAAARDEAVACGDSAQDLEMAGAVKTLYLMANSQDDNPGLREAMAAVDNVVVVKGRMVEGFLEAVKAALGVREQ